MTATEYLERIRTAETTDEAYAVTREAIEACHAGRLTVEEWNAVWIAYDKRARPYRYERSYQWTGD